MALELTAAYVPLIPSMKGFDRKVAQGLNSGGTARAAANAGQSMGSRMSSGLTRALGTGVKIAGAGVASVLGISLTKGFQRLSAIENAEAKLKGLGNSGTATSEIMKNALNSVKGTAFGMDEAATTAASAVAAGVKPGQELQKYLGLVGDAATIAGTDMSSMGSIFNKVMTSGKVQGDVFAQLSDSGIPVVQMLAKEMGVTAEEVYKMGSAGQIGSDVFLKAMGSMEGAALKGGETTTGAFKNMMAALSRFGAGLLKGIYPAIGPTFNKITAMLDGLESKVTPVVAGLSEKIGAALSHLDFSSWGAFTASISDASGALGQEFGPALSSIGQSFGTLRPAMSEFVSQLPSIGASVVTLASGGVKLLAGALSFLADHVDTIVAWMPAIVAGFVAWRVASTALAYSSQKLQWAQVAMAPVLLANNALRLINITLENRQTQARLTNTAATATNTGATVTNNVAQQGGVLARMRSVGAMVAQRTALVATTIATRAAAAGQWLLNAAMSANPFGLIVIAIAGLVAGLVLAYNRIGWFKDFVNLAWTSIKNVAGVVWGGILSIVSNVTTWFTTTALPIISGVTSKIGQGFSWLYHNIAKPVFTGILAVVTMFAAVLLTIAQGIVWVLKNTLGAGFMWLYNNAVRPAMTWVQSKISAVSAWFSGTAAPAVRNTTTSIGNKFTELYNRYVRPAMDWARSKIDWFKFQFNNIKNAVVGQIVSLGNKFRELYNSYIRPVMDWARNKVEWFKRYFWAARVAIAREITSLGNKFRDLYNQYVRPVWDNIRTKITDVWNSIKSKALEPLSNFVKKTIPDAFRSGVDGAGRIWDGLKAKVSKPVRFVVDTVINGGLIKNYNKLNDFWKGDDLPNVSLPQGFYRGGRTGGRPHEVRGLVHGEEVVVNHRSTRDIDRAAPGYLDALNDHGANALGLAAPGAFLPSYGVQSWTGGLRGPIFRSGTLNVAGSAPGYDLPGAVGMVDRATRVKVRRGSGGSNTVHVGAGNIGAWWAGFQQGNTIQLNNSVTGRMALPAKRVMLAHEIGHALGLPHNARGHGGNGAWSMMNYDNMYKHNSVTKADVSALSAIYGGTGFASGGGDGEGNSILGTLKDKILGPFEKLVANVKSKFADNKFMQMGVGFGTMIKDGVLKFALEKLKKLPDFIDDVVGKVKGWFGGKAPSPTVIPELHDNGGILRPGVSVLENRTRKPEAVLNPEQTRTYKAALATLARPIGSGDTPQFHFHGSSGDPTVLARRAAETWAFEADMVLSR